MFEQISIAARVAGTSADDFGGIIKAVEQIFSKGTITAEDFKGQIGDRLAGAMVFLAQGTDTATAALKELMAEGELGADELLFFAEKAGYEYGKALPDALKSAKAELADFKNTITDLQLTVGDSGFLGVLTQALKDMSDELKKPEIKESLLSFAEFLGSIIRFVPRVIPYLEDMLKVLGAVVGLGFAAYLGRMVVGFSQMLGVLSTFSLKLFGVSTAMETAAISAGGKRGLALGLKLLSKRLLALLIPGGAIFLAIEGFTLLSDLVSGKHSKQNTIDERAKTFADGFIESAEKATKSAKEMGKAISDEIARLKEEQFGLHLVISAPDVKTSENAARQQAGDKQAAGFNIKVVEAKIALLKSEFKVVSDEIAKDEFALTKLSLDKDANKAF
ncbi:MAG: tape measure protein, partial [Porticoccus sp.]|nr:tape measure protein [Porticoccus sp.]